jgi:hypothetical protein
VTRYATVRLLTAALFAVLIVGVATVWAFAAGAQASTRTFLLTCVLGLVSFGLFATALLFDSGRRHQLARVLRFRWVSGRRWVRDRPPDDEQLAEMRRRLEYALEGLRSAVSNEPAPASATPGMAMLEDGRRLAPLAREAVTETPTVPAALVSESAASGVWSSRSGQGQRRFPVSPGVAQGVALVRVSEVRYRHGACVAAARARLAWLRQDDRRWMRRATVTRWLLRAVLLLLVPAVLTHQATGGAWSDGVWGGVGHRVELLVALALGVVGSAWTVVVTRPGHGLPRGSQARGEPHAVRSLLATEQLALRLAAGVAPSQAWQAVALRNHFSAGATIPAVAVDEALALVEQLRRVARKRRENPLRMRVAAVVRPLVACLLPASVILLVL